MSRRYSREVSALERYSLVVHEVYRYHVDGIVEGIGTVDPAVLQSAANRAAEANPGVRVRLRGMLGWTRWVDSGIAPPVRLMPLSDWDGCSEQGAPFLQERLDPLRGGPVADILIVPCRDGRTRLVFRTVHAAIDGRGLILWGDDVFRALRGEPMRGSNATLTDLDVQEQYRDRAPAPSSAPPEICLPVVQPGTQRAPLHYVWRRADLEVSPSQLLPKMAAFLASWARRERPGPVRFTIPVDYRGLRTQAVSIGNLLGYLRLDVPEGATPRRLMQQLNQGIRDFADCTPMSGARLLQWIPIRLMVRQLRKQVDTMLYAESPHLPTGGLVSMGNVRFEQFRFPGFEPTGMCGIPGAVGKLNVVFVNNPGVVSVIFSAPAAYNDRGQLDEMVEAFERHFSRGRYQVMTVESNNSRSTTDSTAV